MSVNIKSKSYRSTRWTMYFFYVLIVLEFFYMATPVAVYFYSVYTPGLNLFNNIPGAAWLSGFFLPHIIEETSSKLINLHNIAGVLFVSVGIVVFSSGMIHVYYNKLFKKGAVTSGIYKYIRHPQYLSFAICSFGMLLLWPRYLVLVMFVTVLFVYYLLAKYEEKECEHKFGTAYIEHKNKTNMFLPIKIIHNKHLFTLPASRLKKWGCIVIIYIVSIVLSLGIARIVHKLSINALYSRDINNSLYISVTELDNNTFSKLIAVALQNDKVKGIINKTSQKNNRKYLNYILPVEMYISEIPMSGRNIDERNHFLNNSKPADVTTYKIIFTKAVLRNGSNIKNKDILLHTLTTKPIIEVWIDTSIGEVINLIVLPHEKRYGNTPVPVY
ncbi:methyltransferase family protein [Bacteroidota bacterium]